MIVALILVAEETEKQPACTGTGASEAAAAGSLARGRGTGCRDRARRDRDAGTVICGAGAPSNALVPGLRQKNKNLIQICAVFDKYHFQVRGCAAFIVIGILRHTTVKPGAFHQRVVACRRKLKECRS